MFKASLSGWVPESTSEFKKCMMPPPKCAHNIVQHWGVFMASHRAAPTHARRTLAQMRTTPATAISMASSIPISRALQQSPTPAETQASTSPISLPTLHINPNLKSIVSLTPPVLLLVPRYDHVHCHACWWQESTMTSISEPALCGSWEALACS